MKVVRIYPEIDVLVVSNDFVLGPLTPYKYREAVGIADIIITESGHLLKSMFTKIPEREVERNASG